MTGTTGTTGTMGINAAFPSGEWGEAGVALLDGQVLS
jgi:hypothetical protein